MSSNLTISDNQIVSDNELIDKQKVQKKVDEIVFEITSAFRRTAETWLGISEQLVRYQSDKSLEGKEIYKLVRFQLNEKLGLGQTTLDKMCVIGQHKKFLDKYVDKLPPSYNKIYAIAQYAKDYGSSEIKQWFIEDRIKPDISEEQIKNLRSFVVPTQKSLPTPKKKLDAVNKKLCIEILLTDTYVANNLDEINKKFNKIELLFPNSKSVAVNARGLFNKKIVQGDTDE